MTNLLHGFVAELKSADRTKALVAAISANSARPGPKLRLFTNIYNALPETDPVRCDVFEAIVGVAAGAGEMGVLEEFLPKLDSELLKWGVDAERTRAVYKTLSDKFAAQQGDEASWVLFFGVDLKPYWILLTSKNYPQPPLLPIPRQAPPNL